MNLVLAISIDVEPDAGACWEYLAPLSFHGVEEGIRNRLSPLFDAYAARPTYLINNVVLQDANLETFQELGNQVELGTHLHCEFIEPQLAHDSPEGHMGKANQCFLAPDVEREKLINLTNLFKEKFGYQPISFRAGRFSAGINTLRSLVELEYKVDSSITPGIRWWDDTRLKSIDFRFAPRQPYQPSVRTIKRKGEMSLLEVPVSIAGHWPFERTWMRPLWCDSITETADRIVATTKPATSDSPIVLNCMFHNVDCVEECSPHCKTKDDATAFLSELEKLLEWAKKRNAHFVTLGEIPNALNFEN